MYRLSCDLQRNPKDVLRESGQMLCDFASMIGKFTEGESTGYLSLVGGFQFGGDENVLEMESSDLCKTTYALAVDPDASKRRKWSISCRVFCHTHARTNDFPECCPRSLETRLKQEEDGRRRGNRSGKAEETPHAAKGFSESRKRRDEQPSRET